MEYRYPEKMYVHRTKSCNAKLHTKVKIIHMSWMEADEKVFDKFQTSSGELLI